MIVDFRVKGLEELQRRLDSRRLRLAMSDALKENANRVEQDFQRVVRTWDHKVQIHKEIDTQGDRMEMMVGTDDKIFGWLDRGTKAHGPKNARVLAFRPRSSPKTTPGSIFSGAGGPKGPMIFRPWVKGIKPRRFTQVIQKRLDKYGPAIVHKHVKRWLAKG